jgi:hypothetical protein
MVSSKTSLNQPNEMWFEVITKVFNGKIDGSLANNAVVLHTFLNPEVKPDLYATN